MGSKNRIKQQLDTLGDDNENGKNKSEGLIVQHTFLYISFLLLLHNYNMKLPSYTFYGRNVVYVLTQKVVACLSVR